MKYLYTLICILTAIIGYTIHHSIFWSIMDFLFTPFTWCKWIILHQVNLHIIEETFSWFFKQ